MFSSKYLMRLIAIGASLIPSIFSAQPAYAQTEVLYRETFGYCTASLGKEAADETSWMGMVTGLPKEKFSNLKVFSYGVTDVGGSVNSDPIGLSQGYAFWFRPVYGLTVVTREFPFDVGILKNSSATIEYRQRLSGINALGEANKTHLALLIDDTWYISSEFVRQTRPGVWERVTVTPANLVYGTVPGVAPVGPAVPAVFNAPLPAAGTVRAFGVFIDEVNGRVRLDNFQIRGIAPADGSISTQVQDPVIARCPATSPDRNGGGPPPPPDEDDSDETPDQFTPEAPDRGITPGSGGTHGTKFSFCPVGEQGRGKPVAISRKARAAIVRKIPQTTMLDLRDRALVSILGQRAVPLGAFVNSKRGDYDAISGVLTMSTRAAVKPLKLKLQSATRRALDAYLSHASAPKDPLAPLFVSSGVHAAHVTTQQAACLADIRTALKALAKQAKVAIAGIYTPRRR
jgi:hypothetical protein